MSRLTRDGTAAEPVSKEQILRRERGQGNIHFPCSADHEQGWQPYSVHLYSVEIADYNKMSLLVLPGDRTVKCNLIPKKRCRYCTTSRTSSI